MARVEALWTQEGIIFDGEFSNALWKYSVSKKLEGLLKTLADFREVVRKEAIGIKASNILTECDRLRNEVLPELGVRLEDKENHTVIKLVGKEELKKEMEQLKLAEERKKAEKAKKKAEADAKQAEKEKQMRVNPKEMFQDLTKYSKFDEKVCRMSMSLFFI